MNCLVPIVCWSIATGFPQIMMEVIGFGRIAPPIELEDTADQPQLLTPTPAAVDETVQLLAQERDAHVKTGPLATAPGLRAKTEVGSGILAPEQFAFVHGGWVFIRSRGGARGGTLATRPRDLDI